MSEATAAAPQPQPETWPVLSLNERRVLGVLVEKAKTTPDAYPLTVNALTTGSNQKSNRDPLMNLSDLDVEDALVAAQKRGLVFRITGSRVERWRHVLYDAWRVNKHELAILAELLLRGLQTEGELRARASRMENFEDLEALRASLGPLSRRGLVVYLTAPGRRGTTLTHGFHDPREIEALRKSQGDGTRDDDEVASRTLVDSTDSKRELDEAKAQILQLSDRLEAMKGTVDELTAAVSALTKQMQEVRQGLGL